MRSYHEGKRLSKLFMAFISIVLCFALVGANATTAFAATAVKSGNDTAPKLTFKGIDSIAEDQVCLIVFEDMTQNGADSEGRAIIGGDLEVSGLWSASVKQKFNNEYALAIGGNLTKGMIDSGGCVAIGGGSYSSASITASYCHHGVGNDSVHVDSSGWIKDYVDKAEQAFTAASAQYASLPADGTAKQDGWNQSWTLTANPNHKKGEPHVFYIDMTNAGTKMLSSINFSGTFGTDSIVVNIKGSDIQFTGGNGANAGGDMTIDKIQNQVIWNCYTASTVTAKYESVQGSLLAPLASFSGQDCHVNGTTVVRECHGLGGFEYHTGHFFKNPFSAALTVSKTVVGTPDEEGEKEFKFELRKSNGTLVKSFTLKDGEVFRFSDLEENVTYTVTELDTSSYYTFSSASATGKYDKISGKTVTFTATDGSSRDISFVNSAVNIPKKGKLTVKKVLEDKENPNASFTFTLYNSSWEELGTFTLAHNQTKVFADLPYGNYYVKEENSGEIYNTKVGSSYESNTTIDGATANIEISKDYSDTLLTYTNVRKYADLTVAKQIANGDENDGTFFSFELQKKNSDNTYTTIEKFSLAAGNTKKFNLAAGVTYRVVETDSGANYALSSATNNEIYLIRDTTATFVNAAKKAGLTVTKVVNGKGNSSDTFSFVLQKENGTGWSNVETFSLKAGESKQFTGLMANKNYRVYESASGAAYDLGSITGADDITDGAYAVVNLTENASREVVFTNNVKPGSITVKKAVTDGYSNAQSEFGFTLYKSADNGSSWESVETFSLKAGEQYTASGLDISYLYKVVENTYANYSASNKIGSGSSVASVETNGITLAAGADTAVSFTNTRKTADLTVSKKINGKAFSSDDSFTFRLFKKNGSGWASAGVDDITVKAGASAKFTGLPYGVEYAVAEIANPEYTFTSVEGGTATTINGLYAASVEINGAATLTFTNTPIPKLGGFTVTKQVEGYGIASDKFTFTVEKKNGSSWEAYETFTLKAGETKTFSDLTAGDVYRVYESKTPDSYTIYNVTGADSVSSDKKATVTIADKTCPTVIFTNKVKTGSIKVIKTLEDKFDNAMSNFSFTVYESTDGDTWTAVDTFSLAGGESKTISGLDVTKTYKVVEADYSISYTTKVQVGSAKAAAALDSGEFEVSADAATEVNFTNTRKTGELTVTKKIDGTPYDGDTFTFRLYKKSGSSWVKAGVDDITIEPGKSAKFTGLAYGNTYAVAELKADEYTFVSVSGATGVTVDNMNAGSVAINGDAEVTFTNKPIPRLGGFTVRKALTGASTTEDFTFVIQKKDGLSWKDYDTFTLKAGGELSFTGLVEGDQYRVYESDSGSIYELDTITADEVDGKYALFTIKQDKTPAATFTNKVKNGSITVSKTLTDATLSGESTFSFELQQLIGGEYVKVDEFSISVANGKTASYDVENLPFNETYRIVEKDAQNYDTVVTLDGKDTKGKTSGDIVIDGAESVAFANTKMVTLSVAKAIAEGDNDLGETFTFLVQRKEGSNWNTVKTIAIKASDAPVTMRVETGTYRVLELDGSKGYTYAQTTVDGGQSVQEVTATIDGKYYSGASFILSDAASAVVTNRTVKGHILLNKVLSDKVLPGASFRFTLQELKNGVWTDILDSKGAKVTVELKHGEVVDLASVATLEYGTSYRVIEEVDKSIYETVVLTNGTSNASNISDAVTIGDESASISFTNTRKTASLKIVKALTDGSADLGEVFEISVYKYADDGWKLLNAADDGVSGNITIKPGVANAQYLSLPVGVSYKIVESKTGASYKFDSFSDNVNTDNVIKLMSDEEVTIYNAIKTGKIVITKVLNDEINPDAKFTFTVTNEAGKQVTSGTIGNGESITVDDLPYGSTYTVTESVNGEIYTTTVTAGGKTEDGTSKSVTVNAESTEVVFTNTRETAKVIVNKKLAKGSNLIEGDENGTFTFQLYRNTEKGWVKVGDPFDVKMNGNTTVELPVGTQYCLVETKTGAAYKFDDSDKTATYQSVNDNGKTYTGIEFDLTTKGATVDVYNKNASAGVTVSKTVINGEAKENDTFTFTLQQLVDAKYVNVSTVTIKSGERAEFPENANYPFYLGNEYRIVEGALGTRYEISDIVGADDKDLNNLSATFKLTGAKEITFVNSVKLGELSIKKVLNDTHDADATFTVTAVNAETGEVLGSDSLGNGKTLTIKDLPYGTKVKVTENYNKNIYTATVKGLDEDNIIEIGAPTSSVVFTNTRNTGSLTIRKAVNAGSELGKTFSFRLDVLGTDGKTWSKVDEFKLKADGAYTKTGLALGATYRIIETDTTDSFAYTTASLGELVLDESGNKGTSFTLAKDEDVTISNTLKTASLTIAKSVAFGEWEEGEKFTFVIEKFENGAWTEFKTVELTYENRTWTSGALNVGDKYRVTETGIGYRYELSNIDGADKVDLTAKSAETAIVPTGNAITYTNDVKTGVVKVTKTLVDGFDPSAKFAFTVKNESTGELIDSFELGGGETWSSDPLPYGTKVSVTEAAGSCYTTSVTGLNNNVLTVDAAVKTAAFTNTRKTGSLTVKKALAKGSDDLGESFSFELDVLSADGKTWKKVTAFSLKAGESKKIDGLFVDAQYKLVETKAGDSYNYVSTSIGTALADADGVQFTFEGTDEAVVTNSVKKASLVLNKSVVGNAHGDSFTFTVEKKSGSKFVDAGFGNITLNEKNNYTYTFEKVSVGDVYRITEINLGSRYELTAINGAGSKSLSGKSADVTIAEDGNTVTFVNCVKTGDIIVKKVLEDTFDSAAKFTFTAENLTTGQVYGSKELGSGETWQIADVEYGDKVKITESVDGNVYATSITGLDENGCVVVDEPTINVVFTNKRNTTSVNVKKVVDAGSELGKEFSFVLEVEKDGKWSQLDTFTLKAGETYTKDGLFVGASYRVTETETTDAYSFAYATGGVTDGQTVTFTAAKNNDIVVNNKLNKSGLTITKTIAVGGEWVEGEEFNFKVEKKDADGKWVLVKDNVIVNYENRSADIDGVFVGDTYRVTETNIGYRYELSDIQGTDKVDLTAKSAEIVVDAKGGELVFVNEVKKGELQVKKTLVDSVDPSAEFTFTLYKFNTAEQKYETVDSFKLGNGGVKKFTGLNYGDTYKIVESENGTQYVTTNKIGSADEVQSNEASVTIANESTEVAFKNTRATAKLTVDKELLNGNTTEKFNFVLEKKLASGTWDEVEKFELGAADAVKSFNLEIATDYRIKETAAEGSSYQFSTASGVTNGFVNDGTYYFTLNGNSDVKFVNELKTAKLTVRKIAANATDADEFQFTLYKLNGSTMTAVENFSLKAGETKVFSDLLFNDTYCVKETDTGRNFSLASITGADETKDNYGTVTIDGAEEMTFTNIIKHGKITVKKVLKDNTDPDAVFTFNVYRNGGTAPVDTFTLANGGTYTIETNKNYSVNYGDVFEIRESNNGSYATEIKINDNVAAAAEVEIAADDSDIVFTNTRKTAKLNVAKAIKAGDNVLDDTFTFTLEQKLGGEWKAVGDPFTLSISKAAPTASKEFTLDLNGEYRVTETSSGTNYTFDSITGAARVAGKSAGTVTLEGDTTVTFINTVKAGTISVSKALTDGYKPNAKFNFTMKDASTNKVISTFAIGDGETWTSDALPYGTVVKIEEASNSDYTVTTDGLVDGTVRVENAGKSVKFTNVRKQNSITVKKVLANGGEELDKEFSFRLEIKKGSEWYYVDDFKLKANETKTYNDLYVGAEYRIIETDTSDSFKFVRVTGGDSNAPTELGNGTSFYMEDKRDITFTNELESATLTITKDVENNGDWLDTEAFSFSVEKKGDDGKWTHIQDVTLTKKNKTYTLENAVVSDVYRITETTDNYRYYLKNVTGADSSDVKAKTAQVEIVPTGSTVIFTNDVYEGSITVSKVWSDTYDTEREFTFNVYKNGSATPTDSFTLGNGGKKEITGKYGDTFKIVEVTGKDFATTVNSTVTDENAITLGKGEANVTLRLKNTDVTFTNERKTGSLTVIKALADGSKDLGETFSFELYEQKDGKWNLFDSFELKAKDSKKIENLNVGVEYKLVETKSGKSYNYVKTDIGTPVTGEDAVTFNFEGSTTATVTNTIKKASLVVKKSVVGNAYTDSYSFKLEKKADGSWTDAGTFTLSSANDYTYTLNNASVGDVYRITETNLGSRYTLTAIDGADDEDVKAKTAEVKIVKEGNTVTFENTVNLGKLVISKALDDKLDSKTKFTFSAKNLTNGEDYGTKALGNGDVWEIDNVEYGDKIVVTEAVDGAKYTTTVNGTEAKTATIVISEASNKAEFKNVRNRTGLEVTKKLYNNDGKDLGTTFKFVLQVNKDGSWTDVKEFGIKAGETWSASDLFVGADYRVLETDTTAAFSFKSVNGGTTLSVDKGAQFTVTNNDKVEFTNKLNNATLAIEKIVTGGSAGNDSFIFNLEKKVGDKWVAQDETIVLNKSNGFKWSKDNAIVGEVYRITEVNLDSKYELAAIAGADKDSADIENRTSIATIVPEGNTVSYTNALKTGEIRVTKTLNDVINPSASFAFTLYQVVNGAELELGTFSLKNGETWSSADEGIAVRYGDTFIVRETCDVDTYETKITVDGKDSTADTTYTIAADKTEVNFTNTRRTTDFDLTKTVSGVTEYDEYFEIHMTGVFNDSNGLETTRVFVFNKTGKAPEEGKIEDATYAKIGDTVKVPNVLYGAKYTLEEIGAEYYSCYINEVNTDKSVITTDVVKKGDFSNLRKTANLTVTKAIAHGKDLGDTFKFQLFNLINNEWTAYGEEIELKANESYTYENVPVGLYYKVIETSTGENYIFGSGDKDTTLVSDENEKGAKFFFNADRNVTISNIVKTDSITVRKQIVGEGGDASTEFGFELLKLDGTKWVSLEKFTMKANEYKTIEDLDLGETYKVVEIDTGKAFSFADVIIDNKVNSDKIDLAEQSATVVLDGSEDITFSNTPVDQTITVDKKLTGKSIDLGESFGFNLYKNVNGTWVLEKTFYLKNGESTDLVVTNGIQYKVVEFQTGECYQLAAIDGGDTVDLENAEALVLASTDRNITFTNDVLVGSLTLRKTTSGLASNRNSYTFNVTDENGKPFSNPALSGGSVTLNAGDSVTLNNIPYGTKLVITEDVDETKYTVTHTVSGATASMGGKTTDTIVINRGNTVVNYVNQYIYTDKEIRNSVLGASDSSDPVIVPRTTGTVVLGASGNGYNVGGVSDTTYSIIPDVLGDTAESAPQTGDSFPFAAVVLMAVSGLMVLVLSKKRRQVA